MMMIMITVLAALLLLEQVTAATLEFPSQRILREGDQDSLAEVCVNVTGIENGVQLQLDLSYTNRRAYVEEDFKLLTRNLTFTPEDPQQCLNISIVDDDIYELQEEFFVNFTVVDGQEDITPDFVALTVDDDDDVNISWENSTYTIREDIGTFQPCFILTGMLAGPRVQTPSLSVFIISNTALPGVDYIEPAPTVGPFVGGGRTRICYSMTIINDITFEENKEFDLRLSSISPMPRIIIHELASVHIIDFNVIVQQNPTSTLDGLTRLLNNATIPDDTDCSIINSTSDGEGVECESTDTTFTLTLLPCDESVMLVVRDENGTILQSRSMSGSQAPMNYTLVGDEMFSIQIVTSNGKKFYIISLASYSLTFPPTALPLNCPEITTTSTTVAPSTVASSTLTSSTSYTTAASLSAAENVAPPIRGTVHTTGMFLFT